MALRQPHSLRPVLSTAGVSLGVALGGFSTVDAAKAQEATTTGEGAPSSTVTLDTVVLTGATGSANVNESGTGLSRLPGTVFETPREVQIIPQEIIKQQQAVTLQEALRNVPGITLSTGEGRGGGSGDQFRIRGLVAAGDVYRDGLRDFGAYTHDNFNTESVEVLKGPSGDAFGTGNMGGLINQSSKRAHLTDETVVNGLVGTGPLARIELDTNRVVGQDQALRFNLMGQKQDVADRDHVEADRAGLAIDWGTGIGTGTEWHLGYSYLRGRGTPDMGQPMAEGADGIYRPLLEYDIPGYDRDTSYLRSTDREDTDVHDITSALSHDMGNGWTLSNDTRLARYKRTRFATHPASLSQLDRDGNPTGYLDDLLNGEDVVMSYGAGGGMTYKQDGWGFQNVLAGRGEFATGGIKHKVQVGLDLSYQKDYRRRGTWLGERASGTSVLNPVFDAGDATFDWSDTRSQSTAFNAGLFLSDRMSLGNGWTLASAARLDYFENTFDGPFIASTDNVSTSGSSTKISPSLSVIYEPSENAMGYLTLSRTYRPQGADISVNANSFASEVAGDMEPERSDLIELGGKLNLLDGRLGLTGALFQITKRHSFGDTIDPETGEFPVGFFEAGSGRRIRGLELGATGEIAQGWTLYANYAYQKGEIRGGRGIDTDPTEDPIAGNEAPGVPRHNLSLWTSYAVPQAQAGLPGQVTVAGGIRYASDYFADTDNTAEIPETLSLDMMIAYEQDDWRVALNAYNLTDHQNYASAFSSSRVEPAAGRTFALSIGKRF
ncbi:MAG: TonB-dependent siderophore receptor [Paracoccus sp. (in: a-proteobacteria)]|uniref:TonB-dependent receptor n=1 Tax=Paracoccus sp. TaxID=267 RepID=UPI0039E6E6FD